MIDCPACRDTDELCSHTAPAQTYPPRIPTMRAPWPDALGDLAALRAELRRLVARVDALEAREQTSGEP